MSLSNRRFFTESQRVRTVNESWSLISLGLFIINLKVFPNKLRRVKMLHKQSDRWSDCLVKLVVKLQSISVQWFILHCFKGMFFFNHQSDLSFSFPFYPSGVWRLSQGVWCRYLVAQNQVWRPCSCGVSQRIRRWESSYETPQRNLAFTLTEELPVKLFHSGSGCPLCNSRRHGDPLLSSQSLEGISHKLSLPVTLFWLQLATAVSPWCDTGWRISLVSRWEFKFTLNKTVIFEKFLYLIHLKHI